MIPPESYWMAAGAVLGVAGTLLGLYLDGYIP